jgi:hypothetical protein
MTMNLLGRSAQWTGAMLALTAMTGCMTSPRDGDVVGLSWEKIEFGGFYPAPNTEISVSARNPKTGGFETFATAKTTDDPIRFLDFTTYSWTVKAVIPGQLWEDGRRGARTRVQAHTAAEGQELISVEPNFEECMRKQSSGADILANCKSDHSPSAFIQTRDFQPLVAKFDLELLQIRNGVSTVDLVVKNIGRGGGKLTTAECHVDTRHISRTFNRVVDPGESQVFSVSLSVSDQDFLECGVFGQEADGDPEQNTSNNRKTGHAVF